MTAPATDFTYATHCRVCSEKLPEPFFSLGRQPLANNLSRTLEEDAEVKKYPLDLARCPNCKLVQLTVVVNPEILFSDYLYTTGTSQAFHRHFERMAVHLQSLLGVGNGDLVVDLGSNDGTLLSKFFGPRVLGVEPAANLAHLAAARGIPTRATWWNVDTARAIREDYGPAKLITATNVFAHVDNLHGFLNAVKELLDADGVFVIEVPRLPQMLRDGTWDLIYHEHLSYFDLPALVYLAVIHDLTLFRVEEVDTHGGSSRCFFGRARRSWDGLTNRGVTMNGYAESDIVRFAVHASKAASDLHRVLKEMRSRGLKVAGYTAPAKATVMANYASLDTDDICWIADDAPTKQGRILPGTGIPIGGSALLDSDPPDAVVLWSWNLRNSLLQKLKGKVRYVIIPMPTVQVVDLDDTTSDG